MYVCMDACMHACYVMLCCVMLCYVTLWYVCMYMYVYVCICMYMYVYVCICMHMYVCVCICMYMYVYVCVWLFFIANCLFTRGNIWVYSNLFHPISLLRDFEKMKPMKINWVEACWFFPISGDNFEPIPCLLDKANLESLQMGRATYKHRVFQPQKWWIFTNIAHQWSSTVIYMIFSP